MHCPILTVSTLNTFVLPLSLSINKETIMERTYLYGHTNKENAYLVMITPGVLNCAVKSNTGLSLRKVRENVFVPAPRIRKQSNGATLKKPLTITVPLSSI